MFRSLLLIVTVLLICGCSRNSATVDKPATDPAPTTSASGNTFENTSPHFRVNYPADWTRRQDDDPRDVLTIDAKAGDTHGPEVTLAVPKLPPHPPGIIPTGSVEHGYLKDLSKRLHNVTKLGEDNVKVDGVPARRLWVSGDDARGPRKLVVLIIVKGDHLYLVTGDGPKEQFDTVERAFDMVRGTWTWLK